MHLFFLVFFVFLHFHWVCRQLGCRALPPPRRPRRVVLESDAVGALLLFGTPFEYKPLRCDGNLVAGAETRGGSPRTRGDSQHLCDVLRLHRAALPQVGLPPAAAATQLDELLQVSGGPVGRDAVVVRGGRDAVGDDGAGGRL